MNSYRHEKERTLWLGDADESEEFYLEAFKSLKEQVESIKIIKNPGTEISRGFGFILFKDVATAQRILATYNGKPIPNSEKLWRLNVATVSARPNAYRLNAYNNNSYYTNGYKTGYVDYSVHVGGLPEGTTEPDLLQAFRQRYQSACHSKVLQRGSPNGNGISGPVRCYGFVHFKSKDDHQRCLEDAETKPITIRGATVKVDPTARYPRPYNRQRRISQQSSTYTGSVGDRTPIQSPGVFEVEQQQVTLQQQQQQAMQQQQAHMFKAAQPASPMTYPYPSEQFHVLGYPPYGYAQQPYYAVPPEQAQQFIQIDQNGYPMLVPIIPPFPMQYPIEHMQLEQFHMAQAGVVGGGDQQQTPHAQLQRVPTVPSPHAPTSAFIPSPGPVEAAAVPNVSSPVGNLTAAQSPLVNVQQTPQFTTPQSAISHPYSAPRGNNAWFQPRPQHHA